VRNQEGLKVSRIVENAKHSTQLNELFGYVRVPSTLSQIHTSMTDQETKIPLPKFLKILTNNGVPAAKSMAITGKMLGNYLSKELLLTCHI
jgi:hypothetical protein